MDSRVSTFRLLKSSFSAMLLNAWIVGAKSYMFDEPSLHITTIYACVAIGSTVTCSLACFHLFSTGLWSGLANFTNVVDIEWKNSRVCCFCFECDLSIDLCDYVGQRNGENLDSWKQDPWFIFVPILVFGVLNYFGFSLTCKLGFVISCC